jgi:hypothetical protein
MPQICSYNVENNEEAELDLQAPAGYRISEVGFIYLHAYFILGKTCMYARQSVCLVKR